MHLIITDPVYQWEGTNDALKPHGQIYNLFTLDFSSSQVCRNDNYSACVPCILLAVLITNQNESTEQTVLSPRSSKTVLGISHTLMINLMYAWLFSSTYYQTVALLAPSNSQSSKVQVTQIEYEYDQIMWGAPGFVKVTNPFQKITVQVDQVFRNYGPPDQNFRRTKISITELIRKFAHTLHKSVDKQYLCISLQHLYCDHSQKHQFPCESSQTVLILLQYIPHCLRV